MLEYPEDGLLDVVHDYVEVDLVLLVALGIEGVPQLNYIRVAQFLHYLQFTILVSFILVNFLNSDLLVGLIDYGLKNDAKRAISDDSLSIIGETLGFLTFFVLHCIFVKFVIEVFLFSL